MTCARLFQYFVLQADAYRDYLRDVVEPIDRAAHDVGAFESVMTIEPDGNCDWTQGRLFTFGDHAQRAAFADAMAAQAAAFDGSEAAKERRKAYAETLRRLVAISDYDIS
jgi:hypothetical protein